MEDNTNMLQPETQHQKWVEEDLFKMPCKELKKLARQSNVNPNFRKADLVRALLMNNAPVPSENMELEGKPPSRGRMTRSRTSIFPSAQDAQHLLCKPNVDQDKKPDSRLSLSAVDSNEAYKSKNSRKRIIDTTKKSDESDLFHIVSSIHVKGRPLDEITNKTGSHERDKNHHEEDDKEKTVSRKTKRNKVKPKAALPVHENNVSLGSQEIVLNQPDKEVKEKKVLKKSSRKSVDTKTITNEKYVNTNNDEEFVDHSKAKTFREPVSENDESKQLTSNESVGKSCEGEKKGRHVQSITDKEIPNAKSKPKGRKKKTKEQNEPSGESASSNILESSLVVEGDQMLYTKLETKNEMTGRKRTRGSQNIVGENQNETISAYPNDLIAQESKRQKTNKKGKGIPTIADTRNSEKNVDISGVNLLLEESSDVQTPAEEGSSSSSSSKQSITKSHRIPLNFTAIKCDTSSLSENRNDNQNNSSGTNSDSGCTMPVPVLVRGSTFILETSDEDQNCSVRKENSIDSPARSNTFTIDDNGKKSTGTKRVSLRFTADPGENKNCSVRTGTPIDSPAQSNTFTFNDNGKKSTGTKRVSLRFTADPALQSKTSPSQKPSMKVDKSIGKRIMTASLKQNSVIKPHGTQNTGSSVKKTITKNAVTPGSAYLQKFGVARKAPNFKNIHQKLFGNMESLKDNHQRKMDRAQSYLQSPAPRCAFKSASPRSSLAKETKSPKPQSPAPVKKAKTPGTSQKPFTQNRTAQPNRFGFKTRINKEEANKIAGSKLPPVNIEKKKDNDRKFLQGVRTNKRFMLQMQMRQNLH